jgi:hypothetical protein
MAPVKIVWTRDGQAPARVQTFCFHGSCGTDYWLYCWGC